MKSPLVVRAGGRDFPLAVNTEMAGELMGVSEDTIRRQCESNALPSLRRHGKGAPWRIPTGHLLETLGVPYEVVAS